MNPTGTPSFGAPPPSADGGSAAREQVNVPSLLLLLGAAGGICMWLVGIVLNATGAGNRAVMDAMANNPDLQPLMDAMSKQQSGGAGSYVMPLFAILVNALMLFGALKMRQLQAWPLALTACILGCIPCCSYCCCVLTLVGGIWGLVVLNKPDVKSAFVA